MIAVENLELSSNLILLILLIGVIFTIRKKETIFLFDKKSSLELRGLSAIFIIFSHISHMLIANDEFLYPLGNIASVGSDLFLFISGYWLTNGLLKKPVTIIEFYKTRFIKIFKTLWIILTFLFIMDILILNRQYELSYIISSYFGIFPSAYGNEDISSPMWYLSWLLMFYILLPIFFMKNRLWLTAIILAIISNIIGIYNIFDVQANWLHKLHTNAFPLGIFIASIIYKYKNKRIDYKDIKFVDFRRIIKKFKLLFNLHYHNKDKNIFNYFVLIILFFLFSYILTNDFLKDYKFLNVIPPYLTSQFANLTMMFLLLIFFIIKNFEIKLLSFIGVYSYPIYLLHWPLMSRYDVYFKYLPAWMAIICWFATLILVSYLIQRLIKKEE